MSQTIISNESPQITTIICTYRRPHWLRRAILSVQKQTYQDLCICVYDNCSGDETPEVVAELAQQDSRIHYIGRPENIGLLANYAEAMQEVKTPFFSFLADDDVLLPDFYAAAINNMTQHPEAMFCAGSFLDLSLKGKKVYGHQFVDQILYPPQGMFRFIHSGKAPNLHGTLLRRNVIDKCAGFSREYSWADIDLLLRIAACYPVVTSSTEYVLITAHALDKQHSKSIDDSWEIPQEGCRSLKPLLTATEYQQVEQLLLSDVPNSIYCNSIELLYQGDFTSVKTGLRKLKEFNQYRFYYILKLLNLCFERLPLLRQFLAWIRNSPLERKQSTGVPLVLDYETLINIYNQKKY
jgi:glycosyltransferase involved in cell wall biosynthesis